MTKGLKIAPLLALLGLFLEIPLNASAQTSSQPTPKSGLAAVNSVVVDSFDSVSQWSTNPAAGVEITVHPDSGRHGSGLRLDFDFHGGGGYGIIHRKVNLELPANYEFTFAVRGDAPTNNLEFKLVDTTGANVWWSNNRYFVFPREWRTIAQRKRQICFAWGPMGDRAPEQYDPKPPGCRLGIDIRRVAASLPSPRAREEREASGLMTSPSHRSTRIRAWGRILRPMTTTRHRPTSSFRLRSQPQCSKGLRCRNSRRN